MAEFATTVEPTRRNSTDYVTTRKVVITQRFYGDLEPLTGIEQVMNARSFDTKMLVTDRTVITHVYEV